MPYDSDKQRRFMHWAHPGIAARWDKEGGKVEAADMDMGSKKDMAAGGVDLAGGKYGDFPPKKKGPPKLAVSLGVKPVNDDGAAPDDDAMGGEGDDEEKALKAGGKAAIAALHMNDPLSFAKAMVTIMDARGGGMGADDTEAADMDIGADKDDEPDDEHGANPYMHRA